MKKNGDSFNSRKVLFLVSTVPCFYANIILTRRPKPNIKIDFMSKLFFTSTFV